MEDQHFTARSYDVQVSWEAGRQVTRRIARPDIFHISEKEVRMSHETRTSLQSILKRGLGGRQQDTEQQVHTVG